MDFYELINFLFRESEWFAQVGFAQRNKKALLWLPGKKKPNVDYSRGVIKFAPIRGCTQLAFPHQIKPMTGDSECEICWVGLDIDWDDNLDFDLMKWFADWSTVNQCSMVRSSCSGRGIHLLFVLEKPIKCKQRTANSIVKQITGPIKEGIENYGIHVCKADKRMFWLDGGSNVIINASDYKLKTNIDVELESKIEVKKYTQEVEVSPGVQKYVNIFKDAGVLPSNIRAHNEIYVGNAVKALRNQGEKVVTKSGCSGNGHVNGYIDIQGKRISLWAYADGHVIWNFDDVEAMFK